MFVAEDFVFVHIPKTGGQSIMRRLTMIPGVFKGQSVRDHMNVIDVRHPLFKKDTPKLAFVRNPWSWYASWYHYSITSGPMILFNIISNNTQFDFIQSMNNLFDMIENKRPDLLELYNDQIGSSGNPTETHRKHFHELIEWDCGLLSWNYYHLIFGDIHNINYDNVTIGKTESLMEDALNFFINQGIIKKAGGTDREQQGFDHVHKMFTDNRKLNVTRDYGDYRQYYDDALIERVYQKEHYIATKYDYNFD